MDGWKDRCFFMDFSKEKRHLTRDSMKKVCLFRRFWGRQLHQNYEESSRILCIIIFMSEGRVSVAQVQ